MPMDIPPRNGSLLVAFDREYRIHDLYFPHVGLKNHTASERWSLNLIALSSRYATME